jgi:hypothetical protein
LKMDAPRVRVTEARYDVTTYIGEPAFKSC